jgi:tetratricopeptide (TPR) repeat protein
MADRIERLITILRERRVIPWLIGYAAVSWGLAEATGFAVDNYDVSRRLLDVVVFLIIVFFPAMLVLVWYHGEKGRQQVGRIEAILLMALAAVAIGGSFQIATRAQSTGQAAAQTEFGSAPVVDLGDGSVAVLPFRNSIDDPTLDWLDRGVSELIATHLAQLESLRVVSGQRLFDIMRQEGLDDTVEIPSGHEARITRQAGARFMLTGAVYGRTGDLTMTATLADSRTGEISASANARGPDVFALVDQISAEMSSQITGQPRGATQLTSVAQMTTTSLEAFREFQLGIQATERYETREAADRFRTAVAIDSAFALAHFRLGLVLTGMADLTGAAVHFERARAHLTTASERDRLFIEGMIHLLDGETEEGDETLRELVTKYPDEKQARVQFAAILGARRGTNDPEARQLLEEILQLDPTYGNGYNVLAYSYAGEGDYETADSLLQLYLEVAPNEPNPYDSRGEMLESAQRHEEAREMYREALAVRENFSPSLMHLGRSFLTSGEPARGREEISAYAESDIPEIQVEAEIQIGDSYLHEGEVDAAMEHYQQALDAALVSGESDLPTMPMYKLMGMNLYMHRFREAARVASLIREIQPLADYPIAVGFDSLGVQGNIPALEALKEEVEARYAADRRLQPLAPNISLSMEAWIAHWRGDHERVIEIAEERNRLNGLRLMHFVPELPALIALGRPEKILELVQEFREPNILERDARFPPLRNRYLQYWEARAYEEMGQAAEAIQVYRMLLDEFGDAVGRFPMIADAPTRLAALQAQ